MSDKSFGSRNSISVSFSSICKIIREFLSYRVYDHVMLERETLEFLNLRGCSGAFGIFSFYLRMNGIRSKASKIERFNVAL